MRNTAISFSVCCKYNERKILALRKNIEADFNIAVEPDLEILTVRHSSEGTLDKLINGKTVVFEERFKDTVQCVLKSAKD